MRIDLLKTTPDRAGRYWITLETGKKMALYRQTVEDFALYSGKELSDEEFSPMEILIHSRYNLSEALIDINKIKDNSEVLDIVRAHRDREKELTKLITEIKNLELDLYKAVR